MKNIAIIPARGGSKRIPKKNIKNFCGYPIIYYSIKSAIESNLFDEVMVSTDSEEIAKIAKEYGASVPFFRSEKNSSDFATTADVIIEVVESYKAKDILFEKICCIYPTAPLITIEKLISSYELLIEKDYDSVIPVAEYSVPIQWALSLDKAGKISPFKIENLRIRSQDLEKTYFDAGMFYWMKTKSVIKNNRIICDNSGAVILRNMEMHDIDTIEDWIIAELKYNYLFNY